MKILLVGEYNSSHKTLKEGLVQLGHEVFVVGLGDGFKKRKVDLNFKVRFKKGGSLWLNKFTNRFLKVDLYSLDIQRQFFKYKHLLRDYDIVQLINECTFSTLPKTEKKLLDYLFQHNSKVFLFFFGLDHLSVKYAWEKRFRYSILTPYFEGKKNKNNYLSIVKYLRKDFEELHAYVFKNIKGVIASDLDYHIPLIGHPKYLGMVPNPINTDVLKYLPVLMEGNLIIFHGINRENYFKKGNYLFEEALELLNQKYSDKITIRTVESVPYDTYIQLFDDAHILLDQVFAYDQGFNALEAMAKGKIVFTGAEKEWLEYYGLGEDTVAINALPDAKAIASKLEWLLSHPEKMQEISRNARQFIEQHHHYVNCAQLYFEKWTKGN